MTVTENGLGITGFAERIIYLRAVKLNLHGTQMAVLLGVPHTTLKTWETKPEPGVKPRLPRNIVDIADRYVSVCAEAGLEVDPDWILRGGCAIWSYLTGVEMPQGQMELPYVDHATRVRDVA